MDLGTDLRVELVPAEAVMPHEVADPVREQRIESRLRSEGVLRDPLIVGSVPDVEGYVLLDGTNRLRALRTLGHPWVMAQILDYADQHVVGLRTWCHGAAVPIEEIVAGARTIPGAEIEALAPLGATDALIDRDTLAVALDGGRRYVIRRGLDSPPRPQQLLQLVNLYEEHMVREDCDPENVEERAKRLSAAGSPSTLLAFPPFSRAQVVAMAMNATPIPAGITRHMLPAGRALRVNLPVEVLKRETLEEARTALREHLAGLVPRFYREPTVLFDS